MANRSSRTLRLMLRRESIQKARLAELFDLYVNIVANGCSVLLGADRRGDCGRASA